MSVSGYTEATARLERYLSDLLDDRLELLKFERVGGGWSRQTYRLVVRSHAQGQFQLALRGEEAASLLEDNLDRECQVLSVVKETPVPVPAVYGFESTKTVLGYRFIVMEWIDGTIPTPFRQSSQHFLKEASARGVLGPAWVRNIAALHSVDANLVRAAGLDTDVDANTYLNQELTRWINGLRNARRHPGPLVEEACQWLEANRPAPAGHTALLHGDLRMGNMVVRDDRVVAFLDWELAGLGDWRTEIAYTLMSTHAGKLLAPIPPSMNGLMHPLAFLDQYLGLTNRQITDEELVYFMVFNYVKGVAMMITGIDHLLAANTNDVGRAWSCFLLAGYVDDIDQALTKGLPW